MIRFFCLWFALSFLCVGQTAQAGSPSFSPTFTRAPVTIQKKDGQRVTFDAQWAVSPAQQAYGLMYRQSLAPHEAMLFVFAQPQVASFWMRNTFIPLDMLFISKQREIVQIVANARPQDETPIVSKEPVSFVLEIGGGQAKAQGLSVGDILLQKITL